MFDARTLSRWASAFLGSDSPFAGDFYNEPVLAAPEWWEPVADVVEEVLIWAGDNEILKDGIEAFAKKFTQGFGSKGGLVINEVNNLGLETPYVGLSQKKQRLKQGNAHRSVIDVLRRSNRMFTRHLRSSRSCKRT